MFAIASSTIRILLHSPTMSNSESWRERGNHLLLADNQDMDLSERQVKLKMVIIVLMSYLTSLSFVYRAGKIMVILSWNLPFFNFHVILSNSWIGQT